MSSLKMEAAGSSETVVHI